MRIAVLMGGLSKEREISLRSGRAVASALRRKGYDVVEIDADLSLAGRLKEIKPESVFVALHGKFGEDGTVQGILEWLRIPYTGPSLEASALCFNKRLTKEFLEPKGINTPAFRIYHDSDDWDEWMKKFDLPFPVIVKPNTEGSSIGVVRVFEKEELHKGIREAALLDSTVLVEQMIQGREVTVGVYNGKGLPVVEVVPQSGFYDYTAKYTKGMTDYRVPADLPDLLTLDLKKTAERAYRFLNCEGAVRADFMIDQNSQWFLEMNTIPGMTETSLLPKAALAEGISFEDLCEGILKTARLKIGL